MEFRSDPSKSFPCKSVSNAVRYREDPCQKAQAEAEREREREREREEEVENLSKGGRWIELFDGSVRK